MYQDVSLPHHDECLAILVLVVPATLPSTLLTPLGIPPYRHTLCRTLVSIFRAEQEVDPVHLFIILILLLGNTGVERSSWLRPSPRQAGPLIQLRSLGS